MTSEINTYLFANQIDSIGNFQLTTLQPVSKKIHPVFKTIEIDNKPNNYYLISGYIDLNDEFYACPIQIGFITVKSFEFRMMRSSVSIEHGVIANLILTDKNYNKTKVFPIHIREVKSIPYDIYYFIPKINYINKYILDNQNFDLLDFSKISTFYIQQFDLSEKIYLINNLFNYFKILTYDNGKYRPGKDDYFWKEIEFHNLPDNKYLLELFIDSLKYQNINPTIQNDILSFTLDECFLEYRSAPARTQIFLTNKNNDFNVFVDLLKYQMIANFSEERYSYSKNII